MLTRTLRTTHTTRLTCQTRMTGARHLLRSILVALVAGALLAPVIAAPAAHAAAPPSTLAAFRTFVQRAVAIMHPCTVARNAVQYDLQAVQYDPQFGVRDAADVARLKADASDLTRRCTQARAQLEALPIPVPLRSYPAVPRFARDLTGYETAWSDAGVAVQMTVQGIGNWKERLTTDFDSAAAARRDALAQLKAITTALRP